MLYIYRDREGEEHEFPQRPCDKLIENGGYELIGVIKGGKWHDAEAWLRARVKQDVHSMFEVSDYMERQKHLKDLSSWGYQ